MNQTIQLVNAPLSSNYMKSSRTGTYPPLCIATLAVFLHKYEPTIEIELFDGEITDIDYIIAQLTAHVVGISCNIMTYESALLIAKSAAEKGCKVILGGPYPTSIPEKILVNRPYIDAVVTGEGELALLKYVEGEKYENIPNLLYRKNGKIVRNRVVNLEINSLPIPDYRDLVLEQYFSEYSNRYSSYKPFDKSLALYSRKGCVWRDASNGGCVFCMIPHEGNRCKTPERMWKEIEFYYREYGVDHFWEVCDTFTEDDRWIKELLNKKPSSLDVAFQIYARPNHITPRMAKQLKDLGVYEVFIGVESGDDTILEFSNKGCKTDHSRRAVEALASEGVNTIVSFVLGLPGETSKTLQKTLDFAKELYAFGNIIETSSSILLPIPGSKSFSMLTQVDGMSKKHSSDLLDLEELKRDWCRQYTFVDYEEMEAVLNEMLSIFPLNDTLEQTELQSAPMC